MPKSKPPEAVGATCQGTSSQGMMAAAPAFSAALNMSAKNSGRGMG